MKTVVTKIAGLLGLMVDPLLRRVSYVANARKLVEDLDETFLYLTYRWKDTLSAVEDAERDKTRRRTREVEIWLGEAQDMETEVSNIKAKFEGRCKFPGNICSNYETGRKATKTCVKVKDLYEKGRNLGSLTRSLPLPAGRQIPGTSDLPMESNLEKILHHLAVGDTTVGIFGVAGVGKTTLLKAISTKLSGRDRNDVWFHHVIWVVVSRDYNLEKLQKDIAKSLRIKLPDNKDFSSRVLFNFFNNKKIALLLDDVWEPLDLDAIGIPDEGRTVIFTTRLEDVCDKMKAGYKVQTACLKKEEAWHLFKKNVGDEVMHNSEILSIAKEVANECEGLPLVLIIIGRMMSTKRTLQEWQVALSSLKESRQSAVGERVFQLLKNSYDSLPDDTTRKCFLCCALFPIYHSIAIDELIECFSGHGLIDYRGQAYDYDRQNIIRNLLSASLLESSEEDYVRMHNVVRDMALWIARDFGNNDIKWVVLAGLESKEPLKTVHNWEMAERVSLMHNNMEILPKPKIRCPNLSTLTLRDNLALQTFPWKYFPALTYLDLSGTSITILPAVVAKLVQLRYLNLARTNIVSVNIELRELEKLEHLILRDCKGLNFIPYALISKLKELKVLDLYGCPFIFTSDVKNENIKTNVEELKDLKGRVKGLGLTLDMKTISSLGSFVDNKSICQLTVVGLEESNVHDIMGYLLEIGKSIELLDLKKISHIEELSLSNGNHNDQNQCFYRLKSLSFSEVSSLRKVRWNRVSLLNMFPGLTTISIDSCDGLRSLTWIGHLPCLKYFRVRECNELEEIINDESEDDVPPPILSIFPSIREIHLESLPKLRSICSRTITCPLKHLMVVECPKLKQIPFILNIIKRSSDIITDLYEKGQEKPGTSNLLGIESNLHDVHGYQHNEVEDVGIAIETTLSESIKDNNLVRSNIASGTARKKGVHIRPVKRRLGKRVAALDAAMSRLKARFNDVVAKIEAAQKVDPMQERTSEVEHWLRSVDKIGKKVYSIKDDYARTKCLIDRSVNISYNRKIGRKATNELVKVNDLYKNGGDFICADIRVTQTAPPPPVKQMPCEGPNLQEAHQGHYEVYFQTFCRKKKIK